MNNEENFITVTQGSIDVINEIDPKFIRGYDESIHETKIQLKEINAELNFMLAEIKELKNKLKETQNPKAYWEANSKGGV